MKTFAVKEKQSASVARRPLQGVLRSTGAQGSLKIGQPNDKYEQEADRVADRVMTMPGPKLQRQPMEEEKEAIQTKPLADQITPQFGTKMGHSICKCYTLRFDDWKRKW